MKIPLSWLKKYIDLPFSPEFIAECLTQISIEVDKIESTPLSFDGVIVAKVLETQKHPNADKLRVATIFDGKQTHQVVCGAPNCREGLVTAFATIGASLKDKQGKTWCIKKSKLRDVESFGMLCSADELGLSSQEDGIMELSSSIDLGTPLSALFSDIIFDVSLTPNLGHCMSIYGIARELSAILKTPLKKLESSFLESSSLQSPISVCVEATNQCLRYSSRLVQSVVVGPSPDWLVKTLESTGLRSINNVVDISNYVMLKTGQPLHFFDADQIENASIFISTTSEETKVITLDEIERTLPAEALVIRDGSRILAIAGIMGTSQASVSEKTQNVLIEAALFSSKSIRKTSKSLSLITDASQRFEKGIDPLMLPYALDLATELLISLAQGSCPYKKTDCNTHPFIPKKVTCRKEQVNRILGTNLSLREIAESLERLHLKIIKEHVDSLEVILPSHRNDLHEEIDLIEEIIKLYGLNHLPKKASLHHSSPLHDSPVFCFENKIRNLLLEEGLQEFMTCDLISPFLAELSLEKLNNDIELLSVLQSKSTDYSVLRPSLLAGLLQVVKHNNDQQTHTIAGFEVGRIHFKQKEQYKEQTSIALILSGANTPHHYGSPSIEVDFFDLKGKIENLLDALHIKQASFETSHQHNLQPGRQAYIQKEDICLGVMGEIHPTLLSKFDISKRVYFAELNLQELLKLERARVKANELPLYPCSERDWTMSIRKETPIARILSCIQSLAPSLLEDVFLLDLFESEKIGTDRKNATWRFIYRDRVKTLDLKTVEENHLKLLQMVAEKLHDCIL